MRIVQASTLGLIYGCSEVLLGVTRRSRSTDQSCDRHSLRTLWIVIALAITAAILAANTFRFAGISFRYLNTVSLVVFVAGLFLRWYSIIHLGRFFTVDVAISAGHKVIQSGPYRFVRHPSYSGALLAFVGWGLSLHNWIALGVLLLPVTAAFLWRIHVEENALRDGLGEDYRIYATRTKRLIPFVY